MHFREKGNRIQFIRTTYDRETKSSKYRVVGSMSRLSFEVKPEVLSDLTAAEIAELDVFIEASRNGNLLEGKLFAHKLPHIVARVLDYLETAPPAEKRLIVNHMLRASVEFNGYIRKDRAA